MAKKITTQVSGGETKTLERVETVADVRRELDLDDTYSASINGEPASDDEELEDYNFVSFAPSVKGGN
jgi:hypothetical protein